MKWLKKYTLFKESNNAVDKPVKSVYSNKNIVTEICVSMILINNEFLDNILDRGMSARYQESTHVLLTDLKNLFLSKNRLNLGKFIDNKCVIDEDTSKINKEFDTTEFSIEDNWNKLISSRNIARNIIDKLLPNEKLSSDSIKYIFWIGPNKTKEDSEDIVIELNNGKQYSFYLNKNLNTSKTASFNKFADDIIGEELDNLYKDEYMPKWNKLIQTWVTLMYEKSNKEVQVLISKFIEPDRIPSLGYFQYFDLKHRDQRFKHLGEYINIFDKNILNLSDLLNEVWKNRQTCFKDPDSVYEEWMETKIFILNSKILEHIFTESLLKNSSNEIEKLDDGMKLANGNIKMKLIKTIVEKLGTNEKTVYYLGNDGNSFYQVPSRSFFRENYDDIIIKFDYHVKMLIDKEEDNNDFKFNIIMDMDGKMLINTNIVINFISGEISNRMNAKYKFDISKDFNDRISQKIEQNYIDSLQ